jgi:hypothetical protein
MPNSESVNYTIIVALRASHDMLTNRQQVTSEVTEFLTVMRTTFGATVDDAFARGKGVTNVLLSENGRTFGKRLMDRYKV